MPPLRTPLLVGASLVAFAGNSLLCRAALRAGGTDPATFTAIRIVSGALALAAIARAAGLGLRSARAGTPGRAAALLALLLAGASALAGKAAVDARGALLATISGAVTSGTGYAIWYAVLPSLDVAKAAVVQTAVPVLAAAAGVAFLGETATLRLVG